MTRTRTMRVEDELDDAIHGIAQRERVSVNLVVNRALRRFVDWDQSSASREMVSVPPGLLVKLMDNRKSEEARELGRWAGTHLFIPNLRSQYPTVTVEVALRGVGQLSSYGGRFEFDHKMTGRTHTIYIRHSLGQGWSSYYAGAMEAIFGEYLRKKVRLRVTEELCLCQFDE